MLLVYPVRPEKQAEVPAITHIDGTARVQTVTEASTPLLPAYQGLRGHSGRADGIEYKAERRGRATSTPRRCPEAVYSTGMDALALGDFWW